MKSIFKSHLNGGANLLKNKKLLFAAVLSSVAINCDATLQRIDNAHKKEDTRIFYQIQRKVAGEEYAKATRFNLMWFDTFADIIQRAWENRGKEDFFELVDRNSLQEQRIKYNVSLQINLAFEYIAWLCFRTQRPITRKDVKETAEMISNEFDCGVSGWAARVLGAENPILINLPFHLFGKTWRVAFWLNAINQLEKAKSKENATTNLRDIKGNVIKSLREELNKINNTKLAWNHLQIVSIYLKNRYDFEEFKMINKKCARAVNELHFNPLPITGYMSDKLVLALFPNIQTQFLYHIYDRKINIANEHVINLDGYDIKYTVVDDSFHRKDPVLGCLYNKNGLYLPDIFLKHLSGRNIKFSGGVMYGYNLYVCQKTRLETRLENLDIGYKWLVKQIFEKEKAEKVLSEEQRELPAKNRILKYLCVLFLDESSKLVFLDKSGILADTMNQFTIDIDWSELKKLDKRQRELSVGNIKNCILKRLCGLLLDESNKLTETMKQFIVDIDWNEWEALGEEKRKELEGQKKSGKIKGIVKRFCPRHQQDFEHYIVGTTFAVPRDVNYIKLNDIDFTVKRQIKQIDVSKSVNIIGPSCFSYYKNVTEIIFGNAGIKFNGERIFEGCSSIRRIYVSDVGECGLSYFVQKLIRACLDKYVKVIHCSDKWGVIDLPFLFGETDKPFMESLYSNKWGVIDLPFLFGEIGKPIMETLQERFWKKLGMI